MKEAIISYSYARNNLKATLDMACDNHESVVISRKAGGNVVLISEEDYDALLETLYLMSSKKNYKRILKSLSEKNGKTYKNLKDLKREYRVKA